MNDKLTTLWQQFKNHSQFRERRYGVEQMIVNNAAIREWQKKNPEYDPDHSNDAVIMWEHYPSNTIKTNYSIAQLEAMLKE